MSLLSENQKSQLEIEKMLTPKSFPYEPWHSLFAVVAAAAAAAAAWESGANDNKWVFYWLAPNSG